MNLQVKFSLIFLLVFGVQLAVAGYVCDGFLQSSARDRVMFTADCAAGEGHRVKDFYDALGREIPSSRDRERFLSRCKAGI